MFPEECSQWGVGDKWVMTSPFCLVTEIVVDVFFLN